MNLGAAELGAFVASLFALALAAGCGGQSEHHLESGGAGAQVATGGSGGSPGGTGGGGSPGGTGGGGTAGMGPALSDCTHSVPVGEACTDPTLHCGGPCVNSWQARYACEADTWTLEDVVACGPNADQPPQCHNAFEGGGLTPCCPEGGFDCRDKPDGYPGFGCTPGDNSFCSCGCFQGQQSCGC